VNIKKDINDEKILDNGIGCGGDNVAAGCYGKGFRQREPQL
jgi:hypothetical protein